MLQRTSVIAILLSGCLLVFFASPDKVPISEAVADEEEGVVVKEEAGPTSRTGVITHGNPHKELAAFLTCEGRQFKSEQPIHLSVGVIRTITRVKKGEAGLIRALRLPVIRPIIPGEPGNSSWLSVIGPDGQEVPFKGLSLQFEPGTRDVIYLLVHDFHGRTGDLRHSFDLKTSGKYRIRWHYSMNGPLNGGPWIGHIVSNEIQIEIL